MEEGALTWKPAACAQMETSYTIFFFFFWLSIWFGSWRSRSENLIKLRPAAAAAAAFTPASVHLVYFSTPVNPCVKSCSVSVQINIEQVRLIRVRIPSCFPFPTGHSQKGRLRAHLALRPQLGVVLQTDNLNQIHQIGPLSCSPMSGTLQLLTVSVVCCVCSPLYRIMLPLIVFMGRSLSAVIIAFG